MNKHTLVVFLALLIAINTSAQKFYKQADFVNLINIEKGNKDQLEGFLFADLGAWHGFGLLNKDSLEGAAGFRGPAFVTGRQGGLKWLSESFERLTLLTQAGNAIPYNNNVTQKYLPGLLQQLLEAESFVVSVREVAASDRSTVTAYTIKNTSQKTQSLKLKLSGSISLATSEINSASNNISISVDNGKHYFVFSLPSLFKIKSSDRKNYIAETGQIKLPALQSVTLYSYTTFCPYLGLTEALRTHKRTVGSDPVSIFKKSENRWERYLNTVLKSGTSYMQVERNRNWAVKSMMTLNTNWRSAAGALKHGGVVPATNRFDAFWAWDSWEHAAALSLYNKELAKDQMRTMFDFQTEDGMIIDLISADAKENNTKCSKPPLAGWATYMVFQNTKDTAFVKEIFPKLLAFHKWRYKYRDHDKNGLCEYGGTGPQVAYGQWESGMDVAVKFNGTVMLENSPGAYSLNQESVELNSYLCAEKFYLSFLAKIIGVSDVSAKLKREGMLLKKTIQDKFFDTETGYFYDRRLGTGELVKIIDISGWIPLFTGVATKEQAKLVKKAMLDSSLFGNYFPFSTLNHKHPLYNPGKGYFRGQTWMNYTYFGIRGFKNYNFKEDAKDLTNLIPEKFKGIANPGYSIRESYNSETGEGLDARHFSWSSALSLLLLTEDSLNYPYLVY